MRTPNPQRRTAAMMRTALLFLSLAGVRTIQAQELPVLDTLSVEVVANQFVGAGNGDQFALSGLTADKGYQAAGLTPTSMTLKSLTSTLRSPNESRFALVALAKDHGNALMMISLIATTRRCLLTAIDPLLNQANETGRVIEVTSTMLQVRPSLPPISTPATLCTMDSGKLALHFSTPGFDMVQLTAISYGTPSNILQPMNSQSVMLYFPIGRI